MQGCYLLPLMEWDHCNITIITCFKEIPNFSRLSFNDTKLLPFALQLKFPNEWPEGGEIERANGKLFVLSCGGEKTLFTSAAGMGPLSHHHHHLTQRDTRVLPPQPLHQNGCPSQIITMLSLHAVHFISDSAEISGEIGYRVWVVRPVVEITDILVRK